MCYHLQLQYIIKGNKANSLVFVLAHSIGSEMKFNCLCTLQSTRCYTKFNWIPKIIEFKSKFVKEDYCSFLLQLLLVSKDLAKYTFDEYNTINGNHF